MNKADNNDFQGISFDLPKNQSNVIKVIGVGGGGSNAINHMFKQGIKGVDFVICNTDSQALENSPVPTKIQLGVNLTEGLGAGANPEVGEQAALESFEELQNLLNTNTKMVFITAGMGGGTGTGAAPIIAKFAKELDILTVGIVTIPFQFEGKVRNEQAQLGVEKLRAEVDSLIVINNNKLREVYGNLGFKAGFSKADEVLATASRGIAEVITHHYTQNIDLKDAKTVLSDSGTAIMGSAVSSGSNRAIIAIEKALDSPLLNDNKITGAKNVLLLIVSGREEITLDEIGEINDHIQQQAGHSANIIMGVGEDESLEDSISITIIATGFDTEQQDAIVNTESKKIIHTLEDEQKVTHTLSAKQTSVSRQLPNTASEPIHSHITKVTETEPAKIIHRLEDDDDVSNEIVSKNQETEVPTQNNENDLLTTTKEMLGIDVICEDEFDFEISDVTPLETAEEEKTPKLLFDFPILGASEPKTTYTTDTQQETTEKITYSLDTESTRGIEVTDDKEIVTTTKSSTTKTSNNNLQDDTIKYFNLGELEELEDNLQNAKLASKEVQPKSRAEEEDESFQMSTKIEATNATSPKNQATEELDPMSSSISDLKARAEERRAKMKKFNYQFRNQSNINEIERQPAYKRAGVELDNHTSQQKMSRTSVHTNENGDVSFRSNNSFLHDNVD